MLWAAALPAVGPGAPRRGPRSPVPSRPFPAPLLLLLRDLAFLTGANLPPQALRNGPIFLPPSLPGPLAKGHDWQLQDVSALAKEGAALVPKAGGDVCFSGPCRWPRLRL